MISEVDKNCKAVWVDIGVEELREELPRLRTLGEVIQVAVRLGAPSLI